MPRLAAIKFALTSFLLAAAVTGTPVQAKGPQERLAPGAQATIAVAQLPRQGRATYELIRQGGPFPYEKDGSVFGNRERQLPAAPRGYWREYTVKTPGSRDRGPGASCAAAHPGSRTLVTTPLTTTPVFARSWSDPK